MCISVLIPFYNTKFEYFKECLESIENQTFKLFIEIIIINDGSNEESMIQVNKYLDMLNSRYKKYKIFNLNKNYGIQYALNIGLVKCSYNFVARMDADDIMYPEKLEYVNKYFNEYNPKIFIHSFSRGYGKYVYKKYKRLYLGEDRNYG